MKEVVVLTKSLPTVENNQIQKPLESELTELAKSSAKSLGYSGLSDIIKANEKQTAEELAFANLTNTLHNLEIEVFDTKEVLKYKEQKLEEMKQRERFIPLFSCFIPPLCFAICIYFACNTRDEIFKTACVIFASFSFLASLISLGMRTDTSEANLWVWWNATLEEYKKPVPEFVLRKALQIKEKCPNANFMVHELIKKERPVHADPFLYVWCGSSGYFIEVWEEPKFEAKL